MGNYLNSPHPDVYQWWSSQKNFEEAGQVFELAVTAASQGSGRVTLHYLAQAAVQIYHTHFANQEGIPDLNDWLANVMNINAVGCEKCTATWASGLGKDKADTQDEAKVSAYAHEWQIERGHILCPKCKEES